MQHSKNPRNFHFVTVKPVKFNKIVKDKDKNKSLLKVNLVESSVRSKEEYMDRNEGIKPETVDTSKFDAN